MRASGGGVTYGRRATAIFRVRLRSREYQPCARSAIARPSACCSSRRVSCLRKKRLRRALIALSASWVVYKAARFRSASVRCVRGDFRSWRWHLFHGPGGYIDRVTGQPAILSIQPLSAAKAVFLRIWGILLTPIALGRTHVVVAAIGDCRQHGWPPFALVIARRSSVPCRTQLCLIAATVALSTRDSPRADRTVRTWIAHPVSLPERHSPADRKSDVNRWQTGSSAGSGDVSRAWREFWNTI